MDFLTIVLIAFGLAMDAFAVSIASGVIIKKQRVRRAATYGILFGSFQMFMPVLGFFAGKTFRAFISSFDHWVAFALLFLIGVKMIYEASRMETMERAAPDTGVVVLLGLALATSIDALAVGLSFAVLEVSLYLPVLVIGVTTFGLSFIGVLAGSRFGGFCERRVEILGGLVLIAIGLKILADHLIG